MCHDDYTLMEATINKAVKEQAKELNDKLTEIIFHLKEIKGLLYKQSTFTVPPITLPDLPPATPIPEHPGWQFGWPYTTTCTNGTKSENKKQVLNG